MFQGSTTSMQMLGFRGGPGLRVSLPAAGFLPEMMHA